MPTKRPNVLILFTDQQRYDTIQAAGYPHMITPNLDRLVAEGCLFTHAYTSNPVCMAARHDLLTGLPGRAHGYFSNHRDQPIKDYSLPTIARIFSENGYRTAAIGKMHFQPPRMHHGYSELIQMEEIPRRQDDQYVTFLKEEGLEDIQNIHGVRANLYHTPQTSQMDEEHHPNKWVADRSIAWLEHNGDEPFFLFSSWIHPHPPWATPVEFQGLYKDRNIPTPAPITRKFPFVEPISEAHGDDDTPEEIRSAREAYYSCVTHVDHHLGRILDYLQASGKLDDTLIIFTSDHGEMLYDRGMHQKSLPYDGASRVPFIVRYPDRVEKGVRSEAFVDLMDILPTCLDVCGLEYKGTKYQLVGDSVLAEEPRRSRDYQINSTGVGTSRYIMCRNHTYKYVFYYNGGTEEFYDMANDPQELVNLIGTDRLPRDVYDDLKSRALAHESVWGPEGLVRDSRFAVLEGGRRVSAMHGNTQFHLMDERGPRERAERFVAECEYAIAAEGNHGKKLTEVFNDSAYIRRFEKEWERFGGDFDPVPHLFGKPSGEASDKAFDRASGRATGRSTGKAREE
jgi:arylsulfatase A-like enzyme